MNTILNFSMIWGEESLLATRQGKASSAARKSSAGTGVQPLADLCIE